VIPKTIHTVWIGDDSQRPDACIASWARMNPGWQVKLWGNEDLASYGWVNARHMRTMAERGQLCGVADLMRLEILYNEGGFAVDADSSCRRPLADWLFQVEAFACWENELARPGLIANGYMAAAAENPFIGQMILDLQATEVLEPGMAWQVVGPLFLTKAHRRHQYSGLTIWPSHFFMPRHFTGMAYEGPGPVFADQAWASTLGGYDAPALRAAA